MLWLGVILIIAVALYWELRLAEGAHLGARVVVWLYDLSARRYESIKEFDASFDDEFLGYPFTEALASVDAPRVLDVAAGTARLWRSLRRQVAFDGRVVATDLSAGMLREGRNLTHNYSSGLSFVRNPADRLPFAANSFDAVACLEALEFVPDASAVIRECVRVLRPGGALLLSNRVGPAARWLVGKTLSRAAFERRLRDLGLRDVVVQTWQVDYDLAWATKPA